MTRASYEILFTSCTWDFWVHFIGMSHSSTEFPHYIRYNSEIENNNTFTYSVENVWSQSLLRVISLPGTILENYFGRLYARVRGAREAIKLPGKVQMQNSIIEFLWQNPRNHNNSRVFMTSKMNISAHQQQFITVFNEFFTTHTNVYKSLVRAPKLRDKTTEQ